MCIRLSRLNATAVSMQLLYTTRKNDQSRSRSICGASSLCKASYALTTHPVTIKEYRIVPGKHPWVLAAQAPKFEGGRLHIELT